MSGTDKEVIHKNHCLRLTYVLETRSSVTRIKIAEADRFFNQDNIAIIKNIFRK